MRYPSAALILRSTNKWGPNGLGNNSVLVGAGLCFKVSEYISGWLEETFNKTTKGGLYSTVSITDYYTSNDFPSDLVGLIYEANPWTHIEGEGTLLQLECILADQPMLSNRIRLSNKKDKLGMTKIIIDYQTHSLDKLKTYYELQIV